jgi:Bifunctional DNA primase/polymerase, N-terminal/Primase C terminal 1 (PriCT-1)
MILESDEIPLAACQYAERGWSVIPVQARGERPLVPWLEFQQRVASAAEIDRWFQQWPDANIGIVTGGLSGLIVIDVDPGHRGNDSLEAIERKHGPFPPGIEATTGLSGRHLYFEHPGRSVPNRAGLFPGIDVRCDGGYVVAPPSMHPSSARYRWVPKHGPDDQPLAPLPGWALHLLQPDRKRGHSTSYWRTLVREGVEEGARDSTLASLAGHLLWNGVDVDVALELMLAWNRVRCRPPLPDKEVATVVDSIARRSEPDERPSPGLARAPSPGLGGAATSGAAQS